jgi:hypothetical protein
MEARDRRPVRPTPGDRGSWSHGPIARVQSRPGGPAETTREPEAPAPPPQPAPRYSPSSPARRPPYPPYQPMRQPLPQAGRPLLPPARGGFGLPSLRRNVCPHFYMTGTRGAIPIQAPHLLKGLLRQPSNVSRCQLRGGVHLDEGYVNDVCLTPRFNQCVFYEDELTKE